MSTDRGETWGQRNSCPQGRLQAAESCSECERKPSTPAPPLLCQPAQPSALKAVGSRAGVVSSAAGHAGEETLLSAPLCLPVPASLGTNVMVLLHVSQLPMLPLSFPLDSLGRGVSDAVQTTLTLQVLPCRRVLDSEVPKCPSSLWRSGQCSVGCWECANSLVRTPHP